MNETEKETCYVRIYQNGKFKIAVSVNSDVSNVIANLLASENGGA